MLNEKYTNLQILCLESKSDYYNYFKYKLERFACTRLLRTLWYFSARIIVLKCGVSSINDFTIFLALFKGYNLMLTDAFIRFQISCRSSYIMSFYQFSIIIYGEKKQKFVLIHKLGNRWRNISKTMFCLLLWPCRWSL